MTLKKVDKLLKDYGVTGGIITLLATYAAFFSEQVFVVPVLDPVLLEKILVFLFGVVLVAILYVFKYFKRK